MRGAGFFKTLLLRRLGSSMEAGRNTVSKLLNISPETADDEDEDDIDPSDLTIGLYAGSNRSGFWLGGRFQRCDRTLIKDRVRKGEIKLMLGTDAASEGLNLQKLGTLINIDLPWNPTRLEQRKGRIQRIGQARSQVWIANLRYRDSVEDKVHKVLADRLQAIHDLFGQIPDTLEDVWVKVALKDEAEIAELIDQTTATRNPFDKKYSKVQSSEWENCSSVLNPITLRELMESGWKP
jgi:superfamily II DNA/RNA helicase